MKSKKIRYILTAGVGSLFMLTGCANNQPPTPKIITKKVIYLPQQDEKKALAILIYKQKELEHKVSLLENNNSFTNINTLKQNKNLENENKESKLQTCDFKKEKVNRFCNTHIDTNSTYRAISNVNIRRCSTIHSPIMGKINEGTKVHFLYCDKYCWCLLKNKKGYVYRKLFVKEENPIKIEKIGEKAIKIHNDTNLTKKEKQNKVNKTSNSHNPIIKEKQNKINKKTKVLNADEVIENYINNK